MPNNFMVTGPPGSGKTTVVESTVSALRDEGFDVGGIYCPEIREEGVRQGFEIVDIVTGETKILAHVDQPEGPSVSKYRVNIQNVDEMSRNSIGKALENRDLVIIDEIAPMETYSEDFKRIVIRALDSSKPVLAVIHQKSESGFIGRVKNRSDVEIFDLSKESRANLDSKLADLIRDTVD